MLIQQQYINQRREKANNLVQTMFSGGLRNKKTNNKKSNILYTCFLESIIRS